MIQDYIEEIASLCSALNANLNTVTDSRAVPTAVRRWLSSCLPPPRLRSPISMRTLNSLWFGRTKEVDVDLARSVLEAAGIQSIIKSGYFGESSLLPRVHGIHLVVRSEDAADADRILSIDANESNPWNDEV